MCLRTALASSLNPKAQPWKPTEDQMVPLPSPKSQAVIKLPHQLFPAQPMQLSSTHHIVASPPPVVIGFPPTMEQVNDHHFSPPCYFPASASNYCCLYSYDTELQPKPVYFHPTLFTCPGYDGEKKWVVIQEVENLGDGEKEVKETGKGMISETSSTITEVKGQKAVLVKEMEGLENHGDGGKMVLSTRFVPPRLMRAKRVHSFGGYRKKIEIKKIWRPVNAKTDDGLVAGVGDNSSSPHLPPPSVTVPSLPCEGVLSRNTTVMIKNVPNQFRRDTLMGFLDDCCRNYQLEYDFLYLPMDFRTLDNLGYAFVNFTSAAAAIKFKKVLQNYKWGPVYGPRGLSNSKKVCEITWARIQGKDALVRHFEQSHFTCKTCDFLPVVLSPPSNGSNSTLQQIIGKLSGKSTSPRRGIN